MDGTHASFFSGVGGLDLGLERAGWRTVSFSEIDPYASAVLAERWPGVPNLGNVVDLAARAGGRSDARTDGGHDASPAGSGRGVESGDDGWHRADLWTGGFPCQDLSVAGKRRGMVEGTRSNLAYAFLALVERHRPPAILLENVPGLLSSHGGRDMAALLGAMVELGYGVAYRILDARHFGVPQRRRRVFIVGLRSGPDDPSGRVAAERAAAVLAVGSRCPRHPATGHEAGPGVAAGARPGIDIARAVTGTSGKRHDDDTDTLIGEAAYALRDRAADGLAGRLDGGDDLAHTLTAPDNRHRIENGKRQDGSRYDRIPTIVQSLDTKRGGPDDNEAQAGHLVAFDFLNSGAAFGDDETGNLPTRQGWSVIGADTVMADDPLLPLGLDSHRYRTCGNGVVAPVAEWIGRQLLAALDAVA